MNAVAARKPAITNTYTNHSNVEDERLNCQILHSMLGGERIVHPLTPDLKISKYKNKMNTTDKNYVDRLHNQQVNELNEIKNRLTILEGKPTPAPDGTIHVELDTDKLYEMF